MELVNHRTIHAGELDISEHDGPPMLVRVIQTAVIGRTTKEFSGSSCSRLGFGFGFGFMFPLIGRQHGVIFPWIGHDVDHNDQDLQSTMVMKQRVRII